MEDSRKEVLMERKELAAARIMELKENRECNKKYDGYFAAMASFAGFMLDTYDFIMRGGLQSAELEVLQRLNKELYRDILPDSYVNSFCNPVYCNACFGEIMGQLLAVVAAELRAMIPAVFEQDEELFVIRLELLLEIYQAFVCAQEESIEQDPEEIRQILYWYVSDYSEITTAARTAQMVDSSRDYFAAIVQKSDLSDIRYLYQTGEFISEDQIRIAEYLNRMPEEQVRRMADTYTEGYRIGFEVTGRDLSIKETVNIRYPLGFDRMIAYAIDNFAKMGLRPTMFRAGYSIFTGRSVEKNGVFGANPNKQYDYDHREDQALILDGKLITRKLECLKNAYEAVKVQAAKHAGPAVVECFGEPEFEPITGHGEPVYNKKQQKLSVEFRGKQGQLVNRYIPGEERSFTIIAFPLPSIGADFEAIFAKTVEINTLDYKKYQAIQQKLIDVLDQGKEVVIKGKGANRTNLRIRLHELVNPAAQTNFENCVADVNIPVGEVFTSPVLTGTEGVLHVTKVFLNGLEYRNLELTIADGMVTAYTCSNFEAESENQKYISENIMFHHESLPMGEFAIGTNTTAYVMGRAFGIEAKLPILIAEKTGPHFAFGDTCYSHCEDVVVYNPDGKEIIARENEKSLLRKSEPEKAYFNCHTDITIPYDELGEISVITPEEQVLVLIEDGRFVLEGCEELNIPLEQLQ